MTMKHLFKALLLLLALFLPAIATAHDFEVDGIYYNINGSEVSVTYLGTSPWQYSNEYSGNVTIPSTVTYNGTSYSVTTIGSNAFYYCSGLTSINIPNSVTSIGSDAFYGCSRLTSITIPNSVASIGNDAFYGCSGLSSVNINNLVAWLNISFGYSANPLNYAHHLYLNGEEVKELVIPNSVVTIGEYAFSGCSGLTSVSIPNSVISIGSYAFSSCSGLTSVNIGNSVSAIGNDAFSGCSGLTSVNIPNSVTSIGSCAFYGCTGLTSMNIPNSVISIGSLAFYGTTWYNNQPNGVVYAGLVAYCYKGDMPQGTNVILKEGTVGIASYAFGSTEQEKGSVNTFIGYHPCKALKSIVIPNSVTHIGYGAFRGCTSLTSVYMGNSVTTIEDEAFGFYTKPTNIFCFEFTADGYMFAMLLASLAAYFTAPYWCNFENIVGDAVAPSGITISQDSVEIQLGEQLQLNASVTPANASYKEVSWRSSNDAVATVDNGMVNAVGNGECDIIVSCFGMEIVCHVSVFNRISIDQQEILLLPNHMMTLTPTAPVMPEGFAVTSSDPTVAAARVMNGKVQVVGIKEGTTTITVEATDGTATAASCLVTVYTEVGDLNRDGFTNMDDLTVMINYLLTGNDEGISLTNADVNGNGVSMDDLTVLINYLLTGQWP